MMIKVLDYNIDIVENVSFPDLIKTTSENCYLSGKADDPFFVCDLGDILSKQRLWSIKLPRVEPFFAIKCNPHPLILKLFTKLGIGFDCASKGEISQVLGMGVSPDKIIYANPCKQASHIKYAESSGVKMMTFDSIAELKKIYQYHPKAQLIIRLYVGVTQARCALGLKFGVKYDDVPALLEFANQMNLNVVGVSFHVGSGCFDASAYSQAIDLAREVFLMGEAFGFKFSVLDIGGGFPGDFDYLHNVDLFNDVCHIVNTKIDQYFPADQGVRIIAEPGRYYVSSAFQLSCTVTTAKPSLDENNVPFYDYYLNDGVYGSFNCVIFDHYVGEHYLLRDSDLVDSSETHPSVFWGPTCDSFDKILDRFSIRKLSVGERVIFKAMGAYTMAAGSRFNGFEPPFTRFVVSSAEWKTLASLVASSYDESLIEQIDSATLYSTIHDVMAAGLDI